MEPDPQPVRRRTLRLRWGGLAIINGAAVLAAACTPIPSVAPTQPPPPPPFGGGVTQSPTDTPPLVETPTTPTDGPTLILPTLSPTTTPTPSPSRTPSPTPTPSATPTPRPTPTAVPTRPPTPPPDEAVGNLRPFTPRGWAAPLVVNATRGNRDQGAVVSGGTMLVSWAHHNVGPQAISRTYRVDLYVDDVLASRWTSQGADVSPSFSLISDWDELPANVRMEPGSYKLTLIVDPLNEVVETDETDNRYEMTLTVGGQATPPSTATRKADLAFAALPGATEPVVVTSYAGYPTSGPLSVDVPTHIQYRLTNAGLTSLLTDIPVHIYLDDILVRQTRWKGLLAGQVTVADPWSELHNVLRLTPGEHRLRVDLDPGNVIDEADETNNRYTATLVWGTGAVPAAPVLPVPPQPAAPAPPTRPNLVPGWRFGTDGPVILSSKRDTTKDDAMIAGQRSFVDVTVFNESALDAGPFAVDLFLNGTRVRRFDFTNGVPGGHSTWQSDWDRLLEEAAPAAGQHTLRLVIDPDNAVAETNEGDNVYEKVVTWHRSAADVPTPAPKTTYTDAQAQSILAPLASLLDDRRPVGDGSSARIDDVLNIADAGYFLMTGESFKDALVTVNLLSHADYLAQIDRSFATDFARAAASEYPAILQRREQFKTKHPGYKTRHQGKVAIYVDAERPFADVLGSLMHELGHARQDFLNPALEEGQSTLAFKGIKEAAAQQFERAFWLRLEAFTGLSLLRYPKGEAFETLIDRQIDDWLKEAASEEHSLGYLLQWTAPLADTALSDLTSELSVRALSADSALKLYNHFATLTPSIVASYVSQLSALFNDAAPTIRSLAKRRLEVGLPVDAEGSADLRVPGLLMP